ncbi:MAG: DUF2933 domain-containing protein [Chloroflexota bacterium]|mgnify:CR=1 FL=1
MNPKGLLHNHALLMLLCCLLPIALIAAISFFGLSLGSLSGILPYALTLLCPLMMLFMMRGMMHGHDHGAGHAQHIETTATPVTASVAEASQDSAKPDQGRCH